MIEFFKKKLPAYYIVITAAATTTCVFLYKSSAHPTARNSASETRTGTSSSSNSDKSNQSTYSYQSTQNNSKASTTNSDASVVNGQEMDQSSQSATGKQKQRLNIIRTHDKSLTHSIVLVEESQPSANLSSLNTSLNKVIADNVQTGRLQSASVYVKDMDESEWIGINDSEGYYPGSLMKLAVLICYLKASESNPGILTKTLELDKKELVPSQTYRDQVIRPGIGYPIKELLRQMIERSDNYATLLLNRELDINELNRLFSVLGLHKMDMHDSHYKITARDYSKFMNILYNSSYLNAENSQYALYMLSQSSFNKGMTRNLPQNVIVAHKFGENVEGKTRELHESGIVYTGKRTYLITIMTKGDKVSDLAQVICDISTDVYHYFNP